MKKSEDIVDKNNLELQNALQIIQYTRRSLFLTGKAGTGKSTFLRYISNNIKKKNVVLAPTGIAAINAGGSTLHSFFKLPFHPLLPNDTKYSVKNIRNTLKYNSEKRKIIQELELIIIDEISMVRADIIDFIDKILRVYSHNMREPFGGKQLLLVGDVYQLEPVVKEDERQMLSPFYSSLFFFNAHIFREVGLVSIELKKVYRQNDEMFIALLDNIRTSNIREHDLEQINKRVGRDVSQEDLSIILSSRRDVVDHINEEKLKALPYDSTTFEGVVTGEFPKNSLPTPQELELKLGSQILFIKNDIDRRWVNGTLGVIIGFSDDESQTIFVHTDDNQDVEVGREIWRNVKYTFNEKEKKIEEQEIGTYKQFPLRLAWAITVHKSQGLTFKHVKIDFTGGVFAGGQTYVALSRCTSLEGISLQEPIKFSDVFVRPEVKTFAKSYNNNNLIYSALHQSKADKKYHDCVKAFDRGEMQEFLEDFFIAIHSRYDIEKPNVLRLIRKKLNIINKLNKEKEELNNKLKEREKLIKTLAVEYNTMGRDCEHEGMIEAAVRNYKKALKLCPDYPEPMRRLEKLTKE